MEIKAKSLITVLLALSFCPALVAAQNRSFDCLPGALRNQTADQIISKVQQTYNGVNSLGADFTQYSFVASLEVSETSSGKVQFAKPGRMKWHYTTPDEQDFIVRDSTIWLYQAKERQVVINNISDVLLSDLPVSFLMGIGELTRDFDAGKACRSQEGIVVTLTPKTNSKESKKDTGLAALDLLIDAKTFAPKGAKVTDIGGNVTAIVLKKVILNPVGLSPEAAAFNANFPPGVDIDDRREAAPAISETQPG